MKEVLAALPFELEAMFNITMFGILLSKHCSIFITCIFGVVVMMVC